MIKQTLIVGLILSSSGALANADLTTLQKQARCLIATHRYTKVSYRQHLSDGVYSIYPYTPGTPDGSNGGILYSSNEIDYLDLKPAIDILASQPGVMPSWIQGWIVLKWNGETSFARYSGKYYVDRSPLTLTYPPQFAPDVAPEVGVEKVTDERSLLLEKVATAFADALATAKQRVLEKLKVTPTRDRKSILGTLSECEGILDFTKKP